MERIAEHPILGVPEIGALVTFTLDGKEMEEYEGEPIAAALRAGDCEKLSVNSKHSRSVIK